MYRPLRPGQLKTAGVQILGWSGSWQCHLTATKERLPCTSMTYSVLLTCGRFVPHWGQTKERRQGAQIPSPPQRIVSMDCSKEIVDRYEVHACRGLQGDCPFALWRDAALVRTVEDLVRDSIWCRCAAPSSHDSVLRPHRRFKIALAACPNACTLPQIRDVGIIARWKPQRIGPGCDGCGTCHQVCRENAITIRADGAGLHAQSCVECGACLRACPRGLIEAEGVRLEVLVGGRMGRHPRWAERLCVSDAPSLPGILRAFWMAWHWRLSRRKGSPPPWRGSVWSHSDVMFPLKWGGAAGVRHETV